MKKTLIIGLFCGIAVAVIAEVTKKDNVVVESIAVIHGKKKEKEIPVTVTLTKYQLSKMLEILEEGNGYDRPADPQDTFTFNSVARSTQYSEEYNISSTHLAKKPRK
jgi:hypothetical protein|tara:strand:+ start:89 stop:409 length:321 start_codon:yes stop_codon:yes gene_type:complete